MTTTRVNPKVSQSILGPVYRFKYTVNDPNFDEPVTCDTRILFSATPLLQWHDQLVKIDDPSRFGTWDTPRARRAYVRAYVRSVDGNVIVESKVRQVQDALMHGLANRHWTER